VGYDIENRLTTLSYNDGTQDHRVEYTYGANSFVHIIQKYVDDVLTEETRLVRDGYLIVQERDGSNTALRSYVWSSSALGGIGALTAMVQNSQVYYYLFDGRGNVASVVDESANRVARYVYDAFGELRSVTGSLEQPFRFSTKYYDGGTGLVDFGYRFYVADSGRWLTRDPLEFEGGINLYAYVENNPLKYIDPYGLSKFDKFYGLPKKFWNWLHAEDGGKLIKDLKDGTGNVPEDIAKDYHKEWENLGKQDPRKERGFADSELLEWLIPWWLTPSELGADPCEMPGGPACAPCPN